MAPETQAQCEEETTDTPLADSIRKVPLRDERHRAGIVRERNGPGRRSSITLSPNKINVVLDPVDDVVPGDLGTSLPVIERPKTRGDCVGHVGPCPHLSCRYHLGLEVSDLTVRNPVNPSIIITSSKLFDPETGDYDLGKLPATCALDVADEGPQLLEDVARILLFSRQNALNIERAAVQSFRDSCAALGIVAEDLMSQIGE